MYEVNLRLSQILFWNTLLRRGIHWEPKKSAISAGEAYNNAKTTKVSNNFKQYTSCRLLKLVLDEPKVGYC